VKGFELNSGMETIVKGIDNARPQIRLGPVNHKIHDDRQDRQHQEQPAGQRCPNSISAPKRCAKLRHERPLPCFYCRLPIGTGFPNPAFRA
jgi:hypothetical protein